MILIKNLKEILLKKKKIKTLQKVIFYFLNLIYF